MSPDDSYIPSRLEPEQAMVLSDFKNPDRFVRYIREDVISYHVDNGEVYFTESDVIDIVCNGWTEEEKPNALEELEEYCDIRHDWDRIKKKAKEYDIKEAADNAISGHEANKNNQNDFKDSDYCQICGKDVLSKSLCEKHYHKVRYHYDEVTPANIRQYEHDHVSNSSWHPEYDSCQDCDTTNKPHHAKGYCKTCYYRNYSS